MTSADTRREELVEVVARAIAPDAFNHRQWELEELMEEGLSREEAIKAAENSGPSWSVKNAYRNATAALDALTAAGYAKRSDVVEEKLTADFTKVLPGGVLDDSTFEQIEDALDAIEAPCTDSAGKWLTLPERIRNIKDKP